MSDKVLDANILSAAVATFEQHTKRLSDLLGMKPEDDGEEHSFYVRAASIWQNQFFRIELIVSYEADDPGPLWFLDVLKKPQKYIHFHPDRDDDMDMMFSDTDFTMFKLFCMDELIDSDFVRVRDVAKRTIERVKAEKESHKKAKLAKKLAAKK